MSHEEALGFAHILLIVLVFALEIPVLVVEASADDRIRHLLHKRLTHRAITALMVATILVVVALIFLAGTPESLRITSQSPTARCRCTPILIFQLLAGVPLATAARGLTAAMLVFFGALWVYMMKSDIRTRLVTEMRKSLIRSFESRNSFSEQDVEDLVALGENSSPGHEKLIVLNAVADVCETVQSNDGYDGNELAVLIHGLERIVAVHEQRPTDENVLKAIRVLGSCWRRFEASPHPRDPDRKALIQTACGIGEMAVEFFSDPVARACLDAVPKIARVPFRIGMAALRHDRYFVAMAALTRLRSLVESPGPSVELVALFAHFCAKGGLPMETARRIHGRWTHEQLSAAIDEAANMYYQNCDFATADVIRRYRNLVVEWSSEPPLKSPRRKLPKTQYRY